MMRPVPTWARIFSICSSMIDAGLQVRAQPQISSRNVVEDVLAVGRMDDLGVELDAVEAALDVLERRDRRLRRARELGEAGRGGVDGVAVRHPAALLIRRAGQQPALRRHRQLRAAELPHLGALDLAAEGQHERLHAVTDAEHGDAQLEQLGIEPRRAVGVDGRRPAGEDQALRAAAADLLHAHVVRQQLGEDPALAHPARDQLGVLPAVVEDHDLVGRDLALEGELLERLVRRDGGPVPLGAKLSLRQARLRSSARPSRSAGPAGAACPRSGGTARSSAPRG